MKDLNYKTENKFSKQAGFIRTPKFTKLEWFNLFKNKNSKSSNILNESKTLVCGFTHLFKFTKLESFNFFKNKKNSPGQNNLDGRNLAGGFTHTPKFTKLEWFSLFKNKNSKSSNILNESKTLVSGFTLVETLVAIAIFATSITGLISITARGVNDNVFVKNKLVASYLAQEGVELIRNLRDTYAIESGVGYWTPFINDLNVNGCYSTNGADTCTIDSSQVIVPCDQGVCPALTYDADANLYGYDSITDSIFTRTISVVPIGGSASSEILINSTVSWVQGSRTFSTSFQYNLFDWIY